MSVRSYDIEVQYHEFSSAHFIYFNYYLLQSHYKVFYSSTSENAIDMLPKKSTLIDQKFRIGKYRVSDFCGYFYSSQKPSGRSERYQIVKILPKRRKAEAPPTLVIFLRHIFRFGFEVQWNLDRRYRYCIDSGPTDPAERSRSS